MEDLLNQGRCVKTIEDLGVPLLVVEDIFSAEVAGDELDDDADHDHYIYQVREYVDCLWVGECLFENLYTLRISYLREKPLTFLLVVVLIGDLLI